MVSRLKEHKPIFFVEVVDHVSLRRNILQSLRDILDSMQKFHDFERKKEQKTKKIAELRTIINRTNALIWKLKEILPAMKIAQPKQSKRQKAELAQQAVQPAQKQPKQKSELDMLEDELAMIERKLNKLA